MQRLLLKALFLALLVQLPPAIFCQVLPFRHYGVREGLISSIVNVLYQDSRGYLWIGTYDGISVFDGRAFTNYTTANGLAHNSVYDLIEDRTSPGTMWIGTDDGVSKFTAGHFTTYRYGPPEQKNEVTCLMQDHTGRIWCGIGDSLMQIDRGVLVPVRTGSEIYNVKQIVECGDSLIWIYHGYWLSVYSHRTKAFRRIHSSKQFFHGYRPMCADREGNLWVGRVSSDGSATTLWQIRGTRIVNRCTFKGILGTNFLLDDLRGNLWLGNYNGIHKLPKARFASAPLSHFTVENGLQENTLRAGLFDNEHNLWIGGKDKGISKLSEWNIVKFPLTGVGSAFHNSVATADSNNHIWIVSEAGLWEFFRDQFATWNTHLHHLNGQGLHKFFSIFYDASGKLWLGYRDATIAGYEIIPHAMKPSTLKLIRAFQPGSDYPKAFPLCFIVDRNNCLWYSLGNVGIVQLDPSRRNPLLRVYADADGVPTNYVRNLLQDREGNIWCGSYQDGVTWLSTTDSGARTFRRYTTADGLPDNKIRSLLQDSRGRIWVGTRSGGVAIIDHGTIRTLSTKDGLPSNVVWCLTEDVRGRIWLGTNMGAVYLDGPGSTTFRRNNELFGASVFCSGKTKSGLLWFVSTEGLILYDPMPKFQNVIPPPIYISEFHVDGTARDFRGDIRLLHDQNHCVIDFIGVSFKDEAAVTYQYRMRNLGQDWQPAMSANSVAYAGLRPGRYEFEVQAINADGVASAQPASLIFTIIPPFWQRGWFISLSLLTIAASIGGSIRYFEIRKFHQRIRALEQQRAVERERLRISQDMHDEVGASLTEIAILGELAKKDLQQSGAAATHVQKISDTAREVIDNIGEIIWAINPKNDPLYHLAAYLRHYAVKYFKITPIKCRCEFPDTMPDFHLSAECRRNLFLVAKEALHNIVKHAAATEVIIRLACTPQQLDILIEDNGIEFALENLSRLGNGLHNMKKRLEDIGGTFTIQSQPACGTKIGIVVGFDSEKLAG